MWSSPVIALIVTILLPRMHSIILSTIRKGWRQGRESTGSSFIQVTLRGADADTTPTLVPGGAEAHREAHADEAGAASRSASARATLPARSRASGSRFSGRSAGRWTARTARPAEAERSVTPLRPFEPSGTPS